MASLSALFWIALYYLPVGGALLRLILPLPLILLHLRRGSKVAADGIIIQILLLLILMGPIRGPLFLFPYGILAFWLGWCWLRSKSWWFSWMLGVIIGAIGFAIRVFALSTLVGENLWIIITRASFSLIDKFSEVLNISSSPSMLSIQFVAILLIIFQEIVYVFTIHIIAYSIFPKFKTRVPDPPLILDEFVKFKL